MKKLLLVIMIGIVLAIDLYGVINNFRVDEIKEVNHISETTTTVYVE